MTPLHPWIDSRTLAKAILAIQFLIAAVVLADEPQPAGLYLNEFRPRSMLRVPANHLERAKFPVVDVHTHFRYKLRRGSQQLEDYLGVMQRNHVAVNVSLDGRLGADWAEHAQLLWRQHVNQFVIFVHLDWQGDAADDDYEAWACQQTDFVHRTVELLKEAKSQGASGLKLFKNFGLQLRNADGSIVSIDDQRWDPIWKTCGELGLVVLMHTADPAAFFLPTNKFNERWEELHRHPEWSFAGQEFPRREQLLAARNRVIERHPNTTFIAAHLANNPEDLHEVGRWLDKYPNMYVEIASRIAELGRQPYTARRFLMQYSDRVLFGTDGPWPETRLRLYWRFLETYDEYFPYSEKEFPPQGLWNIYGVGLPDDALRRIYYGNAAKIIPGVKQRLIAFDPDLEFPD